MLKIVQQFYPTTCFKSMHQRSRKYTFSSSMAKINEHTSRFTECIVPTLRFSVMVFALYPFEHFEDGFEVHFTIRKI